MNERIYIDISKHVAQLFEQNPHTQLIFHTLGHTQMVAARAMEIAVHYNLSESDCLVLYAAAWFHDTGYLSGNMAAHEERSVAQMRSFMQQQNISTSEIEQIAQCIMATRMPAHPSGQLEEIICDADSYHFGTEDFKKTNKEVKQELILNGHEDATSGWKLKSLHLLESHRYFTTYCQQLLAKGKQENIDRLKKKIEKDKEKDATADKFDDKQDVELIAENSPKHKRALVSRGIQTMLKLTSQNHLRLSDMADGKANILISVNSIIISVILSVLLRKLDANKYLAIPTIVFLLSTVSTMVIAILATRPKISQGSFSEEDIVKKKTNLLFFGNFHRSSLSEYQWAMSRMMADKEYLYGSLVKDIYYLGVVLGRKYMLIRLAYNVFMIGIIISVIAFGIAVGLHQPDTPVIIATPAAPPL